MKVYLAGRFDRRLELREWREEFQRFGFEVTSRWLDIEGDDEAALVDRCRAACLANDDYFDIDSADAFVLAEPGELCGVGRGGRFVEFGFAHSRGKRLVLVGEPLNVFLCVHEVEWCSNVHEAIANLQFAKLNKGARPTVARLP